MCVRIYTCAQIFLNFWRRSVVGLNFDFLAMNITGFIAYSAFNIGMFFFHEIQVSWEVEARIHFTYACSLCQLGWSVVVFVSTRVSQLACVDVIHYHFPLLLFVCRMSTTSSTQEALTLSSSTMSSSLCTLQLPRRSLSFNALSLRCVCVCVYVSSSINWSVPVLFCCPISQISWDRVKNV